jgi:single-strand DNA-binding protein
MAFVRVEQRNARLASVVRIDQVKGRDGVVAKGTVTIISNTRRGSGDERSEEATAIQWTLWGVQAENAATYLGKGSRVNVVGLLRSNNYTDAEGRDVYGFGFTVEELDYLDTKSESDARRSRQEWAQSYDAKEPGESSGGAPLAGATKSAARAGRTAQGRSNPAAN